MKARRRLTRAERDALAAIARDGAIHRPRTDAHKLLERRALIREHAISIAYTEANVGTPLERRTAQKVYQFVLTLRGLQCLRQLRDNGDRSAVGL